MSPLPCLVAYPEGYMSLAHCPVAVAPVVCLEGYACQAATSVARPEGYMTPVPCPAAAVVAGLEGYAAPKPCPATSAGVCPEGFAMARRSPRRPRRYPTTGGRARCTGWRTRSCTPSTPRALPHPQAFVASAAGLSHPSLAIEEATTLAVAEDEKNDNAGNAGQPCARISHEKEVLHTMVAHVYMSRSETCANTDTQDKYTCEPQPSKSPGGPHTPEMAHEVTDKYASSVFSSPALWL